MVNVILFVLVLVLVYFLVRFAVLLNTYAQVQHAIREYNAFVARHGERTRYINEEELISPWRALFLKPFSFGHKVVIREELLPPLYNFFWRK